MAEYRQAVEDRRVEGVASDDAFRFHPNGVIERVSPVTPQQAAEAGRSQTKLFVNGKPSTKGGVDAASSDIRSGRRHRRDETPTSPAGPPDAPPIPKIPLQINPPKPGKGR